MSDDLGRRAVRPPPPVAAPTASTAARPAPSATDLFSVALQQFSATTTPERARAAPLLPHSSADRGGGGGQHIECDSDGFVDSGDEDEEDVEPAVRRRSATATSSSSSESDSLLVSTFRGEQGQLMLDSPGGSGADDDAEDAGLFVPEPLIDLGALHNKPLMPCLEQSQIPLGSTVWVVDEDDVATQLHCYFSAAYPPVCNGRLSGVVMRHSGQMTLVCFDNQTADLQFSLCLPTSCLSLDPVKPYDSAPRHGESYGLGSGAYGMLGPRAVGRGHATPAGNAAVVTRYLYEAMPAYDTEKLRGTALEPAQDSFFAGAFEAALASVNEHLAAQQQPQNCTNGKAEQAAAATSSGSVALVDALLLRSRIFVFLERYSEALQDARACVDLEPQWLRGYLSVARAHCGLGEFSEAAAAASRAYILLPYSSELERIKEVNGYMLSLQTRLRMEKAGCYMILDGFYRKRLRVSAATAAGVALCVEHTPIVATSSVFTSKEAPYRCSVCFRQLGSCANSDGVAAGSSGYSASAPVGEAVHMSPNTVVSPSLSSPAAPESDESARYCSTECTQRASLYRPLELRHRSSLDHVRSLIQSKGSVTLNILPLEMAALAVRLFLMVVTTHRRLCAKRRLGDSNRRGAESTGSRGTAEKGQAASESEVGSGSACNLYSSQNCSPLPPVYVETALQRLGVYPLCTEPVKSNRLEELRVVYEVLTGDFKTEDRSTFTFELLSQLYSYVSAYFTPVDLNALLPADGVGRAAPHHTVFYLPSYVGCIETAKTISYTSTLRQRGSPGSGSSSAETSTDQLTSRVMGRPALDDPLEKACKGLDSRGSGATVVLGGSGREANCTVQVAPRPALLELVTVAPVDPERRLRCVPVTMALNSDVA